MAHRWRPTWCCRRSTGTSTTSDLCVLGVPALHALGRVRDLVALGGGVVLHVRHAGALAVLALEAAERGAARAGRTAVLVAAAVVGLDHLLALGATHPLHLQGGHVGGAQLLLLAADV